MKDKKPYYVFARCFSGVFFGRLVARRGSEIDLVEARHIYRWKSGGLPRLALSVEDLAILGCGEGTQISGECEVTVLETKVLATCTPEAVRRTKGLPCKG